MGKIAEVIISTTGCSRLRAETAEKKLKDIGLNWPDPPRDEKKLKKKEEPVLHSVEINEVLSAKDKS